MQKKCLWKRLKDRDCCKMFWLPIQDDNMGGRLVCAGLLFLPWVCVIISISINISGISHSRSTWVGLVTFYDLFAPGGHE